MPTAQGLAPESFTITVENDDPIFIYCSQGGHCQGGMVGVINPGNPQVYSSYHAAAMAATTVSAPSNPTGGVTGPAIESTNTGTPSSSNVPYSSSNPGYSVTTSSAEEPYSTVPYATSSGGYVETYPYAESSVAKSTYVAEVYSTVETSLAASETCDTFTSVYAVTTPAPSVVTYPAVTSVYASTPAPGYTTVSNGSVYSVAGPSSTPLGISVGGAPIMGASSGLLPLFLGVLGMVVL